MNAFYEHHRDSIRFGYRCFDRILVNGLIQPFQQPERVVGFFGTYRRLYPVSRDVLRGAAEQFQCWVKDQAEKWNAPIVEAPKGRRDEFARFDAKLRMNITSTVSTALDRFTHGRLRDLFCGRTTFVPELTLNGAILLLDMPVLEWNEDGIIAQQVIKYLWQRAVLARNAMPEAYRTRLVCCFVDEAQGIRYILQRFNAFFASRNVDGIEQNRAAVSKGFRRFRGTPGSLDLADMGTNDFAQYFF